MSTCNGFNKVVMYILPSRQEREILFEATRTCVWLKLDVCIMYVRFETQQRDTSCLIDHQVKYFAKANSAFTIFLHRRHGRFLVYQFKTVSLFSNRDSKVTKRIPSSSSSSSSVTSPSSTARLHSAERIKDVRAHCYCASLVRTLFMTWHMSRHVFQARAPSRNSRGLT